MAVKRVDDGYSSPLEYRSMRTGWTQPEGGVAAHIHEGRVVDFNLTNWTVDVRSQFDRKFFPNLQVASPYMHPNRGEGIYAMPEVNSKCLYCIPSDGQAPFVLAFIMPSEQKEVETEESEGDTSEGVSGMGNATYRGGRPRPKPGDIFLQGRDGQFVILHRGGVLQVGSTELAQRIYIPLGNIITDVSQNYEHHNSGGTIRWGLSSSSTNDNPETKFFQTFRINANDEKADVRLSIGKVKDPTPEPVEDEGELSANAVYNIGRNGMVFDLAFAPQGFDPDTGNPVDAETTTRLKFQFDVDGNAFFRSEGNVNLRVKKKIRLRADEGVSFSTGKTFEVIADEKIRLQARKGIDISSEGGSITLNSGDTPVAAVGSAVDVLITTPIPITTSSGPGTIVPGPNARLSGVIANGSSTVLVPKPG